MIMCFRCTAETRDELDQLLALGSYRDYGEAISAAVRNLVLMEQEVTENGAIIIGDEQAPAPPSPPPVTATVPNGTAREKEKAPPTATGNGPAAKKEKPATKPAAKPARATPVAPAPAPAPAKVAEVLGVPPLFSLDGFPREEPAGLSELPADLWSHQQKIPMDRWVLGQFNRLLPAKVNARALIRLFVEDPKALEIGSAASSVAAQAALLGDYLRHIDAKYDVSRDDALATAFPSAEEGAEKGRTRYANQFVVYQNSKGELSGLMVDLKLINVVPARKERRIVPTRVAWEFAAMPNPLLDAVRDRPPEKFSPQERSFLINHIVRSVPVEAFAYRVILDAVQQGHTSPEQIDAAMKQFLNEDRAGDLSQSFLASQRSGAVSRMSDLGLIERRREGVRVYYAATEDGLGFLQRCNSSQEK